MLWRSPTRESDRADEFRRVHAAWLTRALASARRYPRIPVRPMAAGGFARLSATAAGRRHAREWWALALSRID